MKHQENFKPGDIVTSPVCSGHNVMVIDQYHQWVKVKMIYHPKQYEFNIDCVNNDVYRVFVGDF